MTRFKKELRRRGVKTEEDYMWLPFEISKNIFLEAITVNSETATVYRCYNVITEMVQYDRSMNPVKA